MIKQCVTIEKAKKMQCPFVNRLYPTETTCMGDVCMKWVQASTEMEHDNMTTYDETNYWKDKGRCGA